MTLDFNKIFQEVKANEEKLANCKQHNFAADLNPERKYSKKFQCINCLGTVDGMEKIWYEKGLEHGQSSQ